jgi:hypothetical protein
MHIPVYAMVVYFGCYYAKFWGSARQELTNNTKDASVPEVSSVLQHDSPKIPSMVMTRARFHTEVGKLLPNDLVDITSHIHDHISKPLTDWVAGDNPLVVFHRGFTFASPDGLLVEQSKTGIEAVFQIGGRNIEIDTTPLRGARISRLTQEDIVKAARNFGMFHDMYLDRQYGLSGYAEHLDWEAASKLRISYEVFDEQGQPTAQRVYTEEAPLNLKDYLDDIQFCYSRSNTIHDMREQSPLQIIIQMIAIIAAEVYQGAENCITERNIYHIYAFGFPGGGRHLAQLLSEILEQLGIEYDLKKIHVIPVISASTMRLVVPHGKNEEMAMHRYEGCIDFLESFMENFTVSAFNIAARMLDRYVNATTLELRSINVQRDFEGQITGQVKRVFVDDHLLHRIKQDMYAKHGIPIMTTNKAAVTSWGPHVYQHWYKSLAMELLDPAKRIEDFAFQQQSLVATPIESGFNIILTDFPQEVLSLLAYKKSNKSLPQGLLQRFSCVLISQEDLHIVVRNIGKLLSII